MTTEQLNIIVPAITAIAGATIGAAISYMVGRQQFKATVVSANRQVWINNLRDCIAELQAAADEIATHLIMNLGKIDQIASESFTNKIGRLGFLSRRLKLFINPDEEDHCQLANLSIDLREALKTAVIEGKVHLENYNDIQTKISSVSQKILKDEWKRVKRGD